MASSSSSSPPIKRYHVFLSFHGPDVRRRFLSHLRNQFARKGITTFKDQEIERGHTIGPELVQAIRESRISIVLLSKNYASSSWCLDELLEILKCREDQPGQMVMTVFYDVDPSDVRKQRGEFGIAFKKTCEGKTEEEKQRWSNALSYAATIAGEHSLNWTDEAAMIEKFATDVWTKLNVTLSRDFDKIVGLQAHLSKLISLLCFECDDVKMIGIWGPAGIGKSTIARALFNHLSGDFRLRCFMGNLKGSYKRIMGVDDYDTKLGLQNQLLSTLFNQRDIRVQHLGAIKEWLQDQRVLIILDDVDDLEKLEVLANEPSWFGFRSRIIITTEDKNILKAHGINDTYHVDFPSPKEALEILCLSAFKQSYVRDDFEVVANKVAKICSNLPLGLCVVGSSLCGESKEEWELQLSRIETNLDRKIEDVLRVGYDRLSRKDQSLFLHIACIFNDNFHSVDFVTSMLADSNLDVENGLKTLGVKSLLQIDTCFHTIVMHSLLQQLGRQVVHEQSDEPGKRQFLVEPEEIRDVLTKETGTGSVIGISFDMSTMGEVSVSERAFEGMPNLQFLKMKSRNGNTLRISKDMKYLPHLKLLDWPFYPRKHLPPKFQPKCLIEISMRDSHILEKLWGGIQTLPNLKNITLGNCSRLKEVPNLSKANNLETLILSACSSLVELPSSIRNLHKLKELDMSDCKKLRVIPTNINLASLEKVYMSNCPQLKTFPDISTNINHLNITNTKIEDVPPSVVGRWSRLEWLRMGSRRLKRLTHVPLSVTKLDLTNCGIKRVPDCVTGLPCLESLTISNCRKLVSLQSLPPSLRKLDAINCESLKSVCPSFDEPRVSSFYDPTREVSFINCLSLDEEARRAIIQRWDYKYLLLPSKQVPAEFTHKGKKNSITISSGTFSTSSRFKACLLLSPTNQVLVHTFVCRLSSKGVLINELKYSLWHHEPLPEHLIVFSGDLFEEQRYFEADATTSDIMFEFSWSGYCDKHNDYMIIGCGVQILAEEGESSSSRLKEHKDGTIEVSKDESVVKGSKHTGWWGWPKKLGLRKKKTDREIYHERDR